jgi:hypothetical protein
MNPFLMIKIVTSSMLALIALGALGVATSDDTAYREVVMTTAGAVCLLFATLAVRGVLEARRLATA